eukprot:TRINITY_DN5492_c0_g1_i1.p1 TRINITY_DN5492_c0_g1~~TRINITY_DN5492_c0_g1_i1.p1  ORF type:complete len:152 (-),score=27.55 TRINITY_DN5492_c0_g1_i1:144-599(-)
MTSNSASQTSALEVLEIAVNDAGAARLDAPLQLDLAFRVRQDLPMSRWHLQFVADIVHHKIPVKLKLSEDQTRPSSTSSDKVEHVQLLAGDGVSSEAVSSLPNSALESLGALEARLVADESGHELAAIRLVTDVRRNAAGELQRAIMDPLR